MRVVVVESPNKISKISKCLGPGFVVVATLGHFRDLPDKELGVELKTWTPHYVPLANKAGVIAKLKDAARGASEVLLGTDADREGEAIAWHVTQVLGLRGAKRLRFQELTPAALKKAVANAGPLDTNLVDAQQARRVLDRVVGFEVSPLLSQFGPSHSAGRVQSATLHLVVERERAREMFRAVPFWVVRVAYERFEAAAALKDAKGIWVAARFQSADEAARCLECARRAPHRVEALDTRPAERKPKAPFTTSTLQQAASAQLGLKPSETMALAQALFEKGAITYHRTDSVTLSDEALKMAREWLGQHHPTAVPPEPVRYRNADAAQEAHEAIRPTALVLHDVVLSELEENLFSLISRRFLASQCAPAQLEVTTVRTEAGGARFLARGVVVREPSFLAFLAEDEATIAAKHEGEEDGDGAQLPPLHVGQVLGVRQADSKEERTKPPPRFTQATLTREMERSGIGRPSTYASTVTLLFERRYLAEENKAVLPTPRGRLVDGAVAAAFPEVVAARYTADLERQLDEVAAGKRNWKTALTAWHGPFARQLAAAPEALQRFAAGSAALLAAVDEAAKPTGKSCPRCGQELLLRKGSKGPFLACCGWPKCNYSADPSEKPSPLPCPKCAGSMVELDGKFGRYARCSRRGECDGRVDLSVSTEESCPRCGAPLKDKGTFLGCSAYPTCNFTVDARALAHAKKSGATCPKCGALMVQRKSAKGAFLACLGFPKCRHTAEVPTKKKERAHA